MLTDDIYTYASIYALWLEGKAYVPLHPGQPLERCLDIIQQVGMTVVLDSSKNTRYNDIPVVNTSLEAPKDYVLEAPKAAEESDLAYILLPQEVLVALKECRSCEAMSLLL